MIKIDLVKQTKDQLEKTMKGEAGDCNGCLLDILNESCVRHVGWLVDLGLKECSEGTIYKQIKDK